VYHAKIPAQIVTANKFSVTPQTLRLCDIYSMRQKKQQMASALLAANPVCIAHTRQLRPQNHLGRCAIDLLGFIEDKAESHATTHSKIRYF
jgi:hypothetical protein